MADTEQGARTLLEKYPKRVLIEYMIRRGIVVFRPADEIKKQFDHIRLELALDECKAEVDAAYAAFMAVPKGIDHFKQKLAADERLSRASARLDALLALRYPKS